MLDSSDLAKKIREVRNTRKNNRKQSARNILDFLEYGKHENASQGDLDALLIWAIDQHFGHSMDADILLVAFGLVDGYHYDQLSLGRRRAKFLIDSDVIQAVLKISDDYVSASAKRKKELRDYNLRGIEDERIEKLADFLVEYTMHHNIDTLMCDLKKNHVTALPSPSYFLHKDIQAPKEIDAEDTNLLKQEATSDAAEELQDQEALPSEDAPKIDPAQEVHGSASPSIPNQRSSSNEYNDNSIFKKFRLFVNTTSKATFFSDNKATIHIHLSKTPKSANSKHSHKGMLYCCIVTILLLVLGGYYFARQYTKPPVSELFPTAEEIVLSPNQIYELKVAVLPNEAAGAPLSYVSSNPTVATVSNKGFILAHDVPQGTGYYTTDILIQAESGATATKPVTVKISDDVNIAPVVSEINSYEPDFSVEQKARLVGETEWNAEVNAQIGDKVEFQIQYKNLSQDVQRDVMIRDVLPKNMCYVPNSTILFNGDHKAGAILTDDEIAVTGVNIGNYGPKVNAYVRFTAEVVDNTLRCGNNMLGNWSQCSVNSVALQNYAIVYVHKDS